MTAEMEMPERNGILKVLPRFTGRDDGSMACMVFSDSKHSARDQITKVRDLGGT